MGKMTLLITGASGYLGRAAVAEARARGHLVVAVMRDARKAPPSWAEDPAIVLAEMDLASGEAADALKEAMAEVDVVVHAAAQLVGDDAAQEASTLAMTEQVLKAVAGRDGAAPRLVLISSFSVYGLAGLRDRAVITEESPLEDRPDLRDAYCRAKMRQEEMACKASEKGGFPLWILRPGAIFGPGQGWNAHVGIGFGECVLRLGGGGEIPLSYIDHTADGVISAAQLTPKDGAIEICNLVDSDLPSRRRFLRALRKGGWPRLVIPVPLFVMRLGCWLAGHLPGGLRTKVPGLLRKPVLEARFRPVTYANDVARTRLGFENRLSFEEAMKVVIEHG